MGRRDPPLPGVRERARDRAARPAPRRSRLAARSLGSGAARRRLPARARGGRTRAGPRAPRWAQRAAPRRRRADIVRCVAIRLPQSLRSREAGALGRSRPRRGRQTDSGRAARGPLGPGREVACCARRRRDPGREAAARPARPALSGIENPWTCHERRGSRGGGVGLGRGRAAAGLGELVTRGAPAEEPRGPGQEPGAERRAGGRRALFVLADRGLDPGARVVARRGGRCRGGVRDRRGPDRRRRGGPAKRALGESWRGRRRRCGRRRGRRRSRSRA